MMITGNFTLTSTVDATPLSSIQVLRRAVLPVDTIELAQFLLGKLIVRHSVDGDCGAAIVETEAYPPGDPAAHHYRRMTLRNRSLFRDRGHAYVYRAYGTAWMLNVASETDGVGAGVLLRAAVPVLGAGLMAARRGAVPARDVARGPGRLAAALAVDRALDGLDLCRDGPLFLGQEGSGATSSLAPGLVGTSVRIGITRAVEQPWRFFVRGSRFVSGPGRLNASVPGAGAPPCHDPDSPAM